MSVRVGCDVVGPGGAFISSSVKKNVINIFQFSIFTSDEIKTNSVM